MSTLPSFDSNRLFKYTLPPTDFTYGQKLASSELGQEWLTGEKKGWTTINASTENPWKLYGLMISGIVPRPIAFVSTISSTGVHNLAPFSWFNQVSASPPVISVSVMNGPPRFKDTARNIRDTQGFTVNIISEAFVANANVSSIDAPEDCSEWPLTGLTMEPSTHVKPPRVKESAFSMECELLQIVDIIHPSTGQATTSLVLGIVKYIHVRNDVLKEDGTVDSALLKPVSRMGDTSYATLGDCFQIPKPTWTEEAQKAAQTSTQ